ncbi:hypothetical protein JW796_01545 [Candidatus Dojkabacteria bacterium]|nr:hypothetical protein [Candidatus Dojkabacteria bacterium]
MEDKVNKTYDELKRLSDKVAIITQELRISSSGDIGTQVKTMEGKIRGMETKLNELSFKLDLVKKSTDNLEVYVKEIQKALAMIYRNTDELESRLLEEGRQT